MYSRYNDFTYCLWSHSFWMKCKEIVISYIDLCHCCHNKIHNTVIFYVFSETTWASDLRIWHIVAPYIYYISPANWANVVMISGAAWTSLARLLSWFRRPRNHHLLQNYHLLSMDEEYFELMTTAERRKIQMTVMTLWISTGKSGELVEGKKRFLLALTMHMFFLCFLLH